MSTANVGELNPRVELKMNNIIQWIEGLFGINPELFYKITLSILTIFIIVVLRFVILRIANSKTLDDKVRYHWRKMSSYIAFFLVLIMVGRIWFEGIQTLSTFLGLITAGLAIALQVPIVNLAGWAFILWRRPFEVGDRIEIGQIKGDVIDLRIFMFSMMEIGNWVDAEQSTGRIIHIPNGRVFQEPLANYSKGFEYIWNEIQVLITFESHWEKAEKILLDIVISQTEHLSRTAQKKVREAARKYMIFYTKLTPTVYLSVRDSGVMLTLRYLCDPRQRRGTEQTIWRDILRSFSQHEDIDLAYPTQRFFNNQKEGKPGQVSTSSIDNNQMDK